MLVGARFGWQCFLVPSFMMCDSQINTTNPHVEAADLHEVFAASWKQSCPAAEQVQRSAALRVNTTLVFNTSAEVACRSSKAALQPA